MPPSVNDRLDALEAAMTQLQADHAVTRARVDFIMSHEIDEATDYKLLLEPSLLSARVAGMPEVAAALSAIRENHLLFLGPHP